MTSRVNKTKTKFAFKIPPRVPKSSTAQQSRSTSVVPPRLGPRAAQITSRHTSAAPAMPPPLPPPPRPPPPPPRPPPAPAPEPEQDLSIDDPPERSSSIEHEEHPDSGEDNGKSRGKKRTIDAIVGALDDITERGKARPRVDDHKSPLFPYLHTSRALPRLVPEILFYGLESVMQAGMAAAGYDFEDEEDMEENDEQTESALLKAYNAIMTLIPGFSEYLLAMPRHSIAALIHEMQDICNRARGDDTHLLRNLVLVAILDDPLTDRLNPPLLESDPKVRRGINHPQFARQIVPFAVYDDLVDEATHDATIAGMQKGTIKINDDSLSMIFWAPKERDPDDEEQGMGRNPLLVRLYRGLWLGKTKAYAAPSSVPRGCNAQAHGHLRVTAESIAYVAMQARFACSAVTDWKLADGDWTMQAFYKNIIEALYLDEDDPDEWAEETLRWWNTEIFGKPEGAEEETIAADEKEASHELKNCRSKREARAAKRAAARRAKAAQAAVV